MGAVDQADATTADLTRVRIRAMVRVKARFRVRLIRFKVKG